MEFERLPFPTSETSARDRRRWEQACYRRFHPNLKAYFQFFLHDSDKAHEEAVLVLGKCLTRLHQYDPSKPLQNWLLRVASNHLRDYWRRQKTAKAKLVVYEYQRPLSGGESSPSSGMLAPTEEMADPQVDAVEYGELMQDLQAQFRAWPGAEGEILRRGWLQGQEAKQIGAELNIPLPQVRQTLEAGKMWARGRYGSRI